MAATPRSSTSVRDGRLDVLRGLCLLDMVLVHLSNEGMHFPGAMAETILYWLRFAAGGFVLASGICVGAIHYYRALNPDKRWKTYISLWKRSGFVLLVHFFSSILALILIPMHGYPVYDVPQLLRDIFTFHAGYDLLLFYVFMLAISPLVIELVRRVGVLPVLATSVCIFFWHYDNPYVSLWAIERDFPLIRWQLIFIMGIVIGSKVKDYDALLPAVKWQLLFTALGVSLAIGAISAAERGGWMVAPWWLAVTKMPLSILEVTRYVSLALTLGIAIDRAWPWLSKSRVERFLAAVGVQSLMLWVVHVPIVGNVASFSWPIAIFLAFIGVWLAAVVGTWLGKQWGAWFESLPKLGYVVPVMGSLLVTLVLLRYQVPNPTHALPETSIAGAFSDESAFFDDDSATVPIPIDDDSVSDNA